MIEYFFAVKLFADIWFKASSLPDATVEATLVGSFCLNSLIQLNFDFFQKYNFNFF